MKSKITKETIEALRNDDHKAFEKIFLSYFRNVKFFINGLIKSEDEAEDLSQELFVRLWTNRASIDPEKDFVRLIYSSARNAVNDYFRSKHVRDSYATEQMYDEEATECTEENYYAKEIKLLIELKVEAMPERRQQIYKLSRNEGKSNEEIALQLQISKKTVENQLTLALKELKQVATSFLLLIL